MVSGAGSRAAFKQWLIERVQGTWHATADLADEAVDRVAAELGVQPEVLLEARLNALRARISTGKEPPKHRVGTGTFYQFELLFPEAIYYAWKAEAERRGLEGSALMRAAIHAYLLGSWEPPEIGKHWVWRGMGYKVSPVEYRIRYHSRYPFRERAAIPSGAKRALNQRANRLGVRAAHVVRALVLAIIDGVWGVPGTLKIVDSSTMFDDERRYFTG